MRKVTILNKIVLYLPFLMISFITLIRIFPDLINPIFPGDSGHRLNLAQTLIIHVGNRIWLPLLQIHIYLLYFLKPPLFVYKLIPFFYFLTFLLLLNKLCNKILGKGFINLLFALLLLFSFANNGLILFLGTNLYQEIIVFAFFYILLYVYFVTKKVSFISYLLVFTALLSREYFWIYYWVFFVLYLLFKEKIHIKIPLYFISLGIVPIIWLFFTKQSIFLKSSLSNHNLKMQLILDRVYNFYKIETSGSVLLISLILIICFIATYFFTSRQEKKRSNNLVGYHIFSFISLMLTYLYIFVQNPWRETPNNPRIIAPFLIFIPFWLIISFKNSQFLTGYKKLFVSILIIFGLISLNNGYTGLLKSINRLSSIKKQRFYSEISELTQNYKITHYKSSVNIGVLGLDYWDEYGAFLVGPLLYQERIYYGKNMFYPVKNEVLITPIGYSNRAYTVKKFINVFNRNKFQVMYRNN